MGAFELLAMGFVLYIGVCALWGEREFEKRVNEVGLGKAWEEAKETRKKNGWD